MKFKKMERYLRVNFRDRALVLRKNNLSCRVLTNVEKHYHIENIAFIQRTRNIQGSIVSSWVNYH